MADADSARIGALLGEGLVLAEMQARDKKAALAELCALIADVHADLDPEAMLRVLLERERLGSTGVGEGVAIPHGKLAGSDRLVAAFGRSPQGVDFSSIDERPAHLFFVLFAPQDAAALHLKVLARISRLLKNASFRESLMAADGAAAILQKINEGESQL